MYDHKRQRRPVVNFEWEESPFTSITSVADKRFALDFPFIGVVCLNGLVLLNDQGDLSPCLEEELNFFVGAVWHFPIIGFTVIINMIYGWCSYCYYCYCCQ